MALFLKQVFASDLGHGPPSLLVQECPLVRFYPVADKNPPLSRRLLPAHRPSVTANSPNVQGAAHCL